MPKVMFSVLLLTVEGGRPHGREVAESDFCRKLAILLLEVCLRHEPDDWLCFPNCRWFSTVLAKDSPFGQVVGVVPFCDVEQVLQRCCLVPIFDRSAQRDRRLERVEPLWASETYAVATFKSMRICEPLSLSITSR